MRDLLEAVTIFLKHGDVRHPFNCDHDELRVWGYDVETFSAEEIARLDELGFFVTDEFEEKHFCSFKYGSC